MAKVTYSTVFNHSADQVWAVIRDFNSYPVWVEGINESHIEDGKAGDAVGAIRNFSNNWLWVLTGVGDSASKGEIWMRGWGRQRGQME